jgi:polyhydroxyalkanoate synthesis regulator phasin
MMTRKTILGVAGGAIAVAAVSAGGAYFAATGTHTTSAQTPSGQATATATPNARQAQAQADVQNFLNDLAKNLNIDTTTLTNALKQTAKDQVAAAVQSGKLTQSEANQINQMIDSGQFPKGFGFGIPGIAGRGFPAQVAGLQTAIQNAFQSTVGESMQQFFQEVRSSGQTPDQVFQAHNTSAQAVAQAEANAAKPILDQAVSSGQITQDQENNILNAIQNHGAFGGPGGFGPRGGHGRGGNGNGGGNGAQPNATPGTTSNMQ